VPPPPPAQTAAAAPPAAAPTAAPSACPNCGAAFGEPRPAFCPACGQETALRPPRLGEFLQQFGGAFVSTEGALWRTLRALLVPGELTRQYLAGRRKHYVLPLRLYLTVSVVVLLLLRLAATGEGVQVVLTDEAQVAGDVELDLGVGRAGVRGGRFHCDHLPGFVCERLQRKLALDPKQMEREARQAGNRFLSHLGTAMFVLLPGFALLLKLAYLNRDLRYAEHLIFTLHLHAFWFLAVALSLPGVAWLKALAMLAIPVYGLLAMKRVYAGRWWPLLLRAGAIAPAYLVLLGVSLSAVALLAYFE
jgi:hypothetical protein